MMIGVQFIVSSCVLFVNYFSPFIKNHYPPPRGGGVILENIYPCFIVSCSNFLVRIVHSYDKAFLSRLNYKSICKVKSKNHKISPFG